MLQIISGKFYEGTERYEHPAKGILFSNYAWVLPIQTRIGTLEPVDSYRAVSSYVFSYVNQMEKEERAGGLVRVGDAEIVRQFQLLCAFGLRAYFADDRSAVLTNCRRRSRSSSDRYVPSQFVARIFDDHVRGSMDEVREFAALVDRAIAMPRTRYTALMSALENLDHALQVLNYNLDLAYSILVYCLEALAQGFDEYEAVWKDYDDTVRGTLDTILAGVTDDVAASIRKTLLSASHQKLSARFVGFVEQHIRDEFFATPRPGVARQLRRSDLRRAMKNAYRLRSGYVHRLAKIREQLHEPQLADGDVFRWEREPYVTFNGLLRVVFEVLHQFVKLSPQVEKESFDWRRDLPGIMRMQVAPQYWIWKHEGIESLPAEMRSGHITSVLGGLMDHLIEVFAKPSGALTDMTKLLTAYERLIPQASMPDRIKMVVTYALWNSVLAENVAMPGWADLVFKKYKKEIETCCVETLAAAMLLRGDFGDEAFEACRDVYERYVSERYSKVRIELPHKLEVRMQCELANLALAAGNIDEFRRYAAIARTDAVGHHEAQAALLVLIETPAPIAHGELFPFRAPSTASPGTGAGGEGDRPASSDDGTGDKGTGKEPEDLNATDKGAGDGT